MRPDITISVLGMWQFDNALFDKLLVPAQINKQDVIDTILLECAELPVLYTNWEVLQGAIGLLSKRRFHAWERMATALFEDYNPLHNFNRYEDIMDDESTESIGSADSVNTVNGYNGDAEHDRQNTKGKDDNENEADFFAANLLMPREKFTKRYKELIKKETEKKVLVSILAKDFVVTEIMIKRRIKELGLDE